VFIAELHDSDGGGRRVCSCRPRSNIVSWHAASLSAAAAISFSCHHLKRVTQNLAFEEKHAATSCSKTPTLKNIEYRGALFVHNDIDIWSNKI